MKYLGNIIWFIFVGFLSFVAWTLLGIVLCFTIIGIPFGKQCFKIAKLTIWPIGATVNSNMGKHPIANILWMIFLGWELMITYFFIGLIYCITIIGIPFGKQCFKLAVLALIPFGATVK